MRKRNNKPRTVELVKSTYQPTKAEKEEEISLDKTSLTQADDVQGSSSVPDAAVSVEGMTNESNHFDLENIDLENIWIPLVIKNIPAVTRGALNSIKRLWARWKKTSGPDSLYSFTGPNFIPPPLVRELTGWISDSGQEIVAVDIDHAIGSNRFDFLEGFKTRIHDDEQWVDWSQWCDSGQSKEFFNYRHIATSPSGIEMLLCCECTGGTSYFYSVVLLCFEDDSTLDTAISGSGSEGYRRIVTTRKRTLLKIVGDIALGDRYEGKVEYKNGFLTIGPDEGRYRSGEETTQRLRVK